MSYDVAIIGGGLGGLECAYILAKEGYKVVLLERNNQLGGSLQVFSRNKHIFDTGVHYLGGLAEGQSLDRFFRYLNIRDKLDLRRMSMDGYDRIHFGQEDRNYRFAQGHEAFVASLSDQLPGQHKAIAAYVQSMQEVCKLFPWYNLEDAPASYADHPAIGWNAQAHIESFTEDQRTAQVLAGNNLLYAGHGPTTPFYLHALVVNSYMESAWRLVGGGSQIATNLARNIRSLGGEVRKRAGVSQLRVGADGHISQAILDSGEVLKAKHFISNLHPLSTMRMVGPKHFRKPWVSRLERAAETVSSFTTHLALKPNSLPYMDHNIFHFEGDVWTGEDYSVKQWPEMFFASASPDLRSGKWCDSISLLTYMRSEETAPWRETHKTVTMPGLRGEDYEDFKRNREQQMIEAFEKVHPGIREHIESVHSSTPLTFRDYIGTPSGGMYGLRKDHRSFMSTYMQARTHVPNLFLTGQNLNVHGILGVTISAFVTCSEFIERKKLLKELQEI